MCGLIYLWKDGVLSKFTESEIFTSTRFIFFFTEGKCNFFFFWLNKQDEHRMSFQGAKNNAKHSLESQSGGTGVEASFKMF